MAPSQQPAEFPDPPKHLEDYTRFRESRIAASIPPRYPKAELDDETGTTHQLADLEFPHGLFFKWVGNSTHRRVISHADVHYFDRNGGTLWVHTTRAFLVGRYLQSRMPLHIDFNWALQRGAPVTLDIWTPDTRLYSMIMEGHTGQHLPDTASVDVRMGLATGHVGVRVMFDTDGFHVDYFDSYPSDFNDLPLIDAHLRTELRLANALFWSHPAMATSICAYVAKWAANNAEYAAMNGQAAALGKQLATRLMMQKNVTYVPELKVEQYVDDTEKRIDVVSAFKTQYDLFVLEGAVLQDQLAAWTAMLDNAENDQEPLKRRRDSALEKYNAATKVAENCESQFKADDEELKDAEKLFKKGIAQWQAAQWLNIFTAIFEFVVGLAELCIGDVGGLASVGGAFDTLGTVGEISEKFLSSGTLRDLGDCMASLATVMAGLDKLVEGALGTPDGSMPSLPPIDNISGSVKGDADATAIFTLGEWDKWIEQSDQQMDWAVNEAKITDAGTYRSALRKHAINGKTLAQARAHAVNVGQEYVQLQMELAASVKDVENLRKLQEHYHQEAEVYEEAVQRFDDRMSALQVGVWMDLGKAAAAYRYYSLREFNLNLGPQVRPEELRNQLKGITDAILEADENWDKDFQTFDYHSSSKLLPPPVDHQSLVEGFQKTGKVKFTLTPGTETADSLAKSNTQGLPTDFHNGFHWRMWGMDPILRGAVPRSDKLVKGHVMVNLWVTTEGMFSDIDETGATHYFSAGPQSKLCAYELYESGEINMTTSAIQQAAKHMDRTPFTQWTIELEKDSYSALNLEGLEGLDMHWMGNFMPIKCSRRDSGFVL